jgi:hypothetical protein
MDESFYNMHNGNGEFYLKSHSEEAKKKISAGNLGNKRPDLAERNKTMMTETTKAKMVATRRANGSYDVNPMQGKKHSKESLAKMSEARRLYYAKKKEV